MFYKNWPYWLKGGVIAGIINLGIVLIVYIINTQIKNPMHYNWMKLDYYPYFGKILANSIFITGLFGFIILFIIGTFLKKLNISFRIPEIYKGGGFDMGGAFTLFGSWLVVVSSFVFYFLVGAVIGLIYGKIKNKK